MSCRRTMTRIRFPDAKPRLIVGERRLTTASVCNTDACKPSGSALDDDDGGRSIGHAYDNLDACARHRRTCTVTARGAAHTCGYVTTRHQSGRPNYVTLPPGRTPDVARWTQDIPSPEACSTCTMRIMLTYTPTVYSHSSVQGKSGRACSPCIPTWPRPSAARTAHAQGRSSHIRPDAESRLAAGAVVLAVERVQDPCADAARTLRCALHGDVAKLRPHQVERRHVDRLGEDIGDHHLGAH